MEEPTGHPTSTWTLFSQMHKLMMASCFSTAVLVRSQGKPRAGFASWQIVSWIYPFHSLTFALWISLKHIE